MILEEGCVEFQWNLLNDRVLQSLPLCCSNEMCTPLIAFSLHPEYLLSCRECVGGGGACAYDSIFSFDLILSHIAAWHLGNEPLKVFSPLKSPPPCCSTVVCVVFTLFRQAVKAEEASTLWTAWLWMGSASNNCVGWRLHCAFLGEGAGWGIEMENMMQYCLNRGGKPRSFSCWTTARTL